LFNGNSEERSFMLPRRRFGAEWTLELSTANPELQPESANYGAWTELTIAAHSILVLKRIA